MYFRHGDLQALKDCNEQTRSFSQMLSNISVWSECWVILLIHFLACVEQAKIMKYFDHILPLCLIIIILLSWSDESANNELIFLFIHSILWFAKRITFLYNHNCNSKSTLLLKPFGWPPQSIQVTAILAAGIPIHPVHFSLISWPYHTINCCLIVTCINIYYLPHWHREALFKFILYMTPYKYYHIQEELMPNLLQLFPKSYYIIHYLIHIIIITFLINKITRISISFSIIFNYNI